MQFLKYENQPNDNYQMWMCQKYDGYLWTIIYNVISREQKKTTL